MVHYTPSKTEGASFAMPVEDQLCCATIASVQPEDTVSLCVLDANGRPHVRTKVNFVQPDQTLIDADTAFCAWPQRAPAPNMFAPEPPTLDTSKLD